MNLKDYKFTNEHEWVRVEGDVATIGLSDYAQKELGDVVYVELPSVGDTKDKGEPCSNIESVKAVSDVYAPVSGEVVAVNQALEDAPESINQSPYEDGWILKIRMSDTSQLDALMDSAAYEKFLQEL